MRNIRVLDYTGQLLGIVVGNVMHLAGNNYQITFGGNNNVNIINAIDLNTWLQININGRADIFVVKEVLAPNAGRRVVIAERHQSRN